MDLNRFISLRIVLATGKTKKGSPLGLPFNLYLEAPTGIEPVWERFAIVCVAIPPQRPISQLDPRLRAELR